MSLIPGGSIQALMKELQSDVLMIQQLDYVSLVCFATLLWDWIICFDKELHYIWSKKKTGASWYYIYFRIYSMVFSTWNIIVENNFMTNLKFCRAYFIIDALVDYVLIAVMSTMLQGRVYAMWNRDKRVLYFNGTMWTVFFIAIVTIFGIELPKIKATATPYPIEGCAASVPDSLWIPWIPTIAMELIITAEVAYLTFQAIRSGEWKNNGELYTLLVRDYAVWFASGTLLTTMNLFVYLFAPSAYKNFGVAFFHCIVCTTGCHLVLNLKEAYFKDKEHPTEPQTDGDFQFADKAKTTTGTGFSIGFFGRGTNTTKSHVSSTISRPNTAGLSAKTPTAALDDIEEYKDEKYYPNDEEKAMTTASSSSR